MTHSLVSRRLVLFLCVLGGSLGWNVSMATVVTGPMEMVYDGDTFEIYGKRIRLQGIDAPEIAQTCHDNRQRSYACGEIAASYLKRLVAQKQVRCQSDEKDKYGRLISKCFVGQRNINRAMIEAGWAVAYRRYDTSYVMEEEAARDEKRGLWQGHFTDPEAFRAASWKAAQTEAGNPDNQCLIKGNINSGGVRIYHTPWGSRHYDKVRISANKGERWFCSEAEALAARWRAPYR